MLLAHPPGSSITVPPFPPFHPLSTVAPFPPFPARVLLRSSLSLCAPRCVLWNVSRAPSPPPAQAVPFLYELRALLDWTCSATPLNWYQWLKLEDIRASLFVEECRCVRLSTNTFGCRRACRYDLPPPNVDCIT